ncbi:Chaperone DnaJ-domain superfamily protein [Hirschfeldia incana]|nr:Chaperone DnaJ-domain superfamily protein [Hirschfeldia incana]
MGEQRQIRSRFSNRMPSKRCSANGIMNEFIVVDDDEVIILDFPESSKGKSPEASRTRDEPVLQRVISIDDDDDDDRENVVHKDGSSSSRSSDAATNLHGDDDDCQFVQEKRASFRFTKCSQGFSTVPSSGTRFGLDSESESDFSESDCSDCEILEGSQGEVREQWEKAFLEKMKKAGKAGLSEETGPSNIHCETNFRPGFESRTEQHDPTSSFFTARTAHRGKKSSSAFSGTEKSSKAGPSEEAGPSNLHGDPDLRHGCESGTYQHDQTPFFSAKSVDGRKETSSTFFGTEKSGKAGLGEDAGPSNLHCDTNLRSGFESRTYQPSSFTSRNTDDSRERSSTFFGTKKSGKTGLHDQASSFFTARNPDGGKETSSTFFGTDNRNPKSSLFAEPSSLSTPEIQVEHERSNSPTTNSTSSKKQRKQNSFKEVEEQPGTMPVQCQTSEWPKENQKKKAAEHSNTKEVGQEEEASKSSPPHTSDGDGDTPPMLGKSNGARCERGIGETREPIVDPIPSTSEQVQGLQGTAPEVDVMLNREMLKETDEYKKAQEEEWESRQRQLQLQAEEAQRQRKRRKLANTRQLEMERRQKERVEEVRETQKKDEESMNMKEKVRAEITKSLKLLELSCFNMAALLRGLGIPVNGGISPPPQEVHAAYKRAVLKFHPDRARGDIKQQVEAEEKFKLIARMKDKFLS